jgi:hypothetical protein
MGDRIFILLSTVENIRILQNYYGQDEIKVFIFIEERFQRV